MSHPYQKQLEDARKQIAATSDAVNKALAADDLFAVRNFLNERANQSVNFINGLLGNVTILNTPVDALAPLGPVTSFLGKPIERKQPVQPTDINVSMSDKEIFQQHRDALYADIPNLTNDDLLKKLNVPEGEMFIRSCAKKAGITNWKSGAINVKMLDAMRAKIVAEQAAAKALEDAAKAVDTTATTTEPVTTETAATDTTSETTGRAATTSEGAE